MKKIIFLVATFFLFISCKKKITDDTTLSGKWEWYMTFRDITPPLIAQNSGFSWSLVLNADLTCTQSGNLHSSFGFQNSVGTGTYTLTQVTPDKTFGFLTLLLPNYQRSYKFIKNHQDSLILDEGVPGFQHFLVRK